MTEANENLDGAEDSTPGRPTPLELLAPELQPAEIQSIEPVSDADAAMAGGRLGIVTLKAPLENIAARATIGRYLRQIGVVDLGRGVLAVAENRIDSAIAQCDAVAAESKDPKMKLNALRVKAMLTEQLIQIGRAHIAGTAADTDGKVGPAVKPMPFPVGMAISVAVNSKKREEPS